jgi:glycosyltransferase involved in cell wall biosynthesis
MSTLTVCIPNYNHAHFLPQALDALLTQSRLPDEIVVIDDASTDDSMTVLERYARQAPLIRVLRNERNLGVIQTANRLLEEATGEWILFSAADDFLLPGALEQSMALLEAHPEAGLCSGLSRLVEETGADLGMFGSATVTDRPRYLTPAEVRRLLSRRTDSWFVQGNTAIYRRDAVVRAGGYREDLHAYCDSFVSQVVALRHGACFVPRPLAAWRRLEDGFSSSLGRDPERRRNVDDHVAMLMTTEFADVFGVRHATHWRRQAEVSAAATTFASRHGAALARCSARGGRLARPAARALRAMRIAAELALMVRHGLPVRALVRERIERVRIRRAS